MITSRQEKMHDVQDQIFKDAMRDKRKKITKKTIKIVLIVVLVCTSFYLYVSRISTHGVLVREERIKSRTLPYNFDSYKVIFFSDLYYNKNSKHDLDKTIKLINERKPDLVLYSGSLVKDDISNKDREYLVTKLKSINSSSKYALVNDDTEKNILIQSGFTTLNNSRAIIYKGIGSPITVTGINDLSSTDNNEDIGYNIVMLQNPDDAINVYRNADLMLSSGNLAGDVCLIPNSFLCLYKTDNSKTYYKHYYKINDIPLYISSGIGTNKIPFRFNARPSIYFFRFTSNS